MQLFVVVITYNNVNLTILFTNSIHWYLISYLDHAQFLKVSWLLTFSILNTVFDYVKITVQISLQLFENLGISALNLNTLNMAFQREINHIQNINLA